MHRIPLPSLATSLALLLGTALPNAGAQTSATTFNMRFMSPETALKAAQATLANCRAQGFQVAVAVVDRTGIAADHAAFEALWTEAGMTEPAPAVDFDTEVAIWFGILVLIVVGIGLTCPPIGLNVFVVSAIARDVPIASIYRGVLPFVAADIVRLALVTAFPAIALLLVRLLE